MKRLFHYTSINNLALILASRKIRFSRLDKVNDPSEGITGDFHNFSYYIFVSCWTSLEEESLALWNMYTPLMRGVRIELPLPIFNSYAIDDMDNFLVPRDMIVDKEKCIFTSGGINDPIKIVYTDDPSKLKPNIRTDVGLKTTLLGRCKRNIWSFENEYRYTLDIIPIDPNINSKYFPDRYEHLIENNIPPSIDGYYVAINDSSFVGMKIVLSPKVVGGDYEIVNALVDKYNPKAKIQESRLKGLIR